MWLFVELHLWRSGSVKGPDWNWTRAQKHKANWWSTHTWSNWFRLEFSGSNESKTGGVSIIGAQVQRCQHHKRKKTMQIKKILKEFSEFYESQRKYENEITQLHLSTHVWICIFYCVNYGNEKEMITKTYDNMLRNPHCVAASYLIWSDLKYMQQQEYLYRVRLKMVRATYLSKDINSVHN